MTKDINAINRTAMDDLLRLIGFDDMFNALTTSQPHKPSYPPYDYVRTGENSWRLDFAVAGYSRDDLNITVDQNFLIVEGKAPKMSPNLVKDSYDGASDFEEQVLHKGIARRQFSHAYNLAEGLEVTNCQLRDGILSIDLKKPPRRKVDIKRISID